MTLNDTGLPLPGSIEEKLDKIIVLLMQIASNTVPTYSATVKDDASGLYLPCTCGDLRYEGLTARPHCPVHDNNFTTEEQ